MEILFLLINLIMIMWLSMTNSCNSYDWIVLFQCLVSCCIGVEEKRTPCPVKVKAYNLFQISPISNLHKLIVVWFDWNNDNVISTIKSYISLYILLSCWFALPPMLLDKTLYPMNNVYNFFNLFTNKQLAQIDCCIIVNCWVVALRYHQCFLYKNPSSLWKKCTTSFNFYQ